MPAIEAATRGFPLPGRRYAAASPSQLPRLALAIAALLGPHAWLRGVQSRRGCPRAAERRWAEAALRWLDVRVVTTGAEHIQPNESYLVIALHEGFADAAALLRLPLDLRFVARSELWQWPVLGPALARGDHIAVSPEAGAAAYRRILRQAGEVFDRGESLVIFPQGSILGIETGFAPGAFRLAQTLQRPLLPVVLTGSHRVWEHPFSPLVRFGQPVHMHVLAPVAAAAAGTTMRSLERRMKRLALASAAPVRRFVPERDGWWDDFEFTIDPDFPDLAARFEAHRRTMRALAS